MEEIPRIISGGIFEDERGRMRYVNDFKFEAINRFYMIKHNSQNIIRAWQGHKLEKKYFYTIIGAFVIAWVKIDNFQNPSPFLKAEYYEINSRKSEILFLPPGYANGIKASQPNSELMIFSNLEVNKSGNDITRYDQKLWFDWQNLRSLN